MEYIWILFAFICGVSAKTLALPPSIGFLIAGFILNFAGFEADESLEILANLGITLMLFTIGLKLNIKDLLKNEVWLGCITHTGLWFISLVGLFKLALVSSLTLVDGIDMFSAAIIVFSLSFSSTVCIVKLLEEQGEMKTRHGKLSIGILVMQDIIAVVFLLCATGKIPSIWAFALLGLFVLRPILFKLINYVGHGELIPLTGFFLALGSYELFELVQIKGDFGALLIGMFLAGHPKATELSKALLSFKDIFLIGFFLSIGFVALPTLDMFYIASILVLLLIPLKFTMFFVLFSALKLRCRTSFLGALILSNFSEFGLIIAALSVSSGWLAEKWLVILAITVSLSFILTSVVYKFSHRIFAKYKAYLKVFERPQKLTEDIVNIPKDTEIIIIGMGRVGMGAHRAMTANSSAKVWGMDAESSKVELLNATGYNSYVGDAEDAYFWQDMDLSPIKLVLLALPSVQDSVNITTILRAANYHGKIAAIARYEDEREKLEGLGIDKVFNFYTEAGVGFADESIALIQPQTTPLEPIQLKAS